MGALIEAKKENPESQSCIKSPLRVAMENVAACLSASPGFPPVHSCDKRNLDAGVSRYNCFLLNPQKASGRDIFQKSGHFDINGDLGPVESVTSYCQIAKMPLEFPKIPPCREVFCLRGEG